MWFSEEGIEWKIFSNFCRKCSQNIFVVTLFSQRTWVRITFTATWHNSTVNAVSQSLSFFKRHWVNWIARVQVRFIRKLSQLLLLSPPADIRWLIIHVWFPSNASLHTFSNLKHLLWESSCPWSCMASGREANSISIHYQLCESVEISNLPWLLSYGYLPVYHIFESLVS